MDSHAKILDARTWLGRFLPRAYVVRQEGTVFAGVCLSTPGEVATPSPSHDTSTDPIPFWGWYPSDWSNVLSRGYPSDWSQVPSQGVPLWPGMGYPLTRSGWGKGTPGWGTPARDGVPPGQVWTGVYPRTRYRLARDGVTPPPDRTAEVVLAMRRTVCLLRSRRRTFLYEGGCQKWNPYNLNIYVRLLICRIIFATPVENVHDCLNAFYHSTNYPFKNKHGIVYV